MNGCEVTTVKDNNNKFVWLYSEMDGKYTKMITYPAGGNAEKFGPHYTITDDEREILCIGMVISFI